MRLPGHSLKVKLESVFFWSEYLEKAPKFDLDHKITNQIVGKITPQTVTKKLVYSQDEKMIMEIIVFLTISAIVLVLIFYLIFKIKQRAVCYKMHGVGKEIKEQTFIQYLGWCLMWFIDFIFTFAR